MCLGWSGTETDLQPLTANGHAGLLPARNDNIVDEAGERRNAADEEGGYSPPIATPSGRVAVDAMKIIHIGNRYLSTSYDVVAVVETSTSVTMHTEVGPVREIQTYSNMRIPVIGPKNMVYPPRKARNFAADARIFHCGCD